MQEATPKGQTKKERTRQSEMRRAGEGRKEAERGKWRASANPFRGKVCAWRNESSGVCSSCGALIYVCQSLLDARDRSKQPSGADIGLMVNERSFAETDRRPSIAAARPPTPPIPLLLLLLHDAIPPLPSSLIFFLRALALAGRYAPTTPGRSLHHLVAYIDTAAIGFPSVARLVFW